MLHFVLETPPPCGYAPAFNRVAPPQTANVNAGDGRLYVGGGGINKAFKLALESHQPVSRYSKLHKDALSLACQDSAGFVVNVASSAPAVCFSAHVPLDFKTNAGFCCLSVFERREEPFYAMLYVVGPRGAGLSGEKFRQQVHDTASNMARLVDAHNEVSPYKVDHVRLCLVSGGVYRHPAVSKATVASQLLTGIQEEGSDVSWILVEDDDAFGQALRDLDTFG
ncbi:MAG: uncharacterized protein KVP18_000535 [Porospora cf. gigantea A]|uniref:uncharacterized protein n=1 Tax=Porospora cf. gigantea A TaxID=2853593 RepID=UPI00355AB2A0|nr:MAG: hypothetical protein KVP18_000535 [Porospora cf. gigantea A]